MAINEKNGKPAVTHYKVLERFGDYTYIQFKLDASLLAMWGKLFGMAQMQDVSPRRRPIR